MVNIVAMYFKPYEHVCVILHNSRLSYILYLALMKINAVCVPLSPLLSKESIDILSTNAHCVVLVAEEGQQLPSLNGKRLLIASQLERAMDDESSDVKEPVLPRAGRTKDLAHIMFSSGTTGIPKGICLNHRVRFRYAWYHTICLGVRDDSVLLHSGSLVFNGAFCTLMPHLLMGTNFVLLKAFDTKQFVTHVVRYGVTHTLMVPTQIFQILPHLPELQSIQCLVSVGAPLPLATKLELQRGLANRLNEIYGLTEGFSTFLNSREAVQKQGSVGRPMPFARMRIVNEKGELCKPFQVGEIQGRSPLTFQGYYNDPKKTREAMTEDDWLKTGDLGYVDTEGFLFLAGRSKDMIISGGVNVYPIDIEEKISQHFNVKECAVFGIDDPKWGETPVAAIVLRDDGLLGCGPEELKDWINAHLNARHERVSAVFLVKDFPRNAAAKILKADLKKQYLSLSKSKL